MKRILKILLLLLTIYLNHYLSKLLNYNLKIYSKNNLIQKLIEIEQNLISQNLFCNISLIIEDENIEPEEITKTLDIFLMSRPWWYVYIEPYQWKRKGINNNQIILNRMDIKYDLILKERSQIQYPSDCSKHPMLVEKQGGFDSFGNSFDNYHGMVLRNRWAIFTPYIIDEHSTSTSFLDEDYCPHIQNKFECAFLPATNCSFPKAIDKFRFFKTSDPDGIPLNDEEVSQLGLQYFQKYDESRARVPQTSRVTYFNYSNPIKLEEFFENDIEMYMYGELFRLNYDFRSKVAYEIHKFKSSLASPFPTGDCVSVHIRRHKDRAPYHLRGEAIRHWCKKYLERPDGTCWDDEAQDYIVKGDCIHSQDYGCHTANPYGYLTLEHYLNATNIVSKSNNVYLRTDDDKFVREEIKHYKGNKKIFYFPADHNHRSSSTSSGVSYMAAIELARECNTFVGHGESAVTNLFMNNLCIRHFGVIGKCPDFFDFARKEE